MTKNEFLELLKNTLVGQIPDLEIESNMKYYEEYIREEGYKTSEEEVINQLGDPRLIAKTIIDTYQLSHEPMFHNTDRNNTFYGKESSYNNDHRNYKNEYSDNTKHNKGNDPNRRNFSFNISTSLNWIQKAFIATIFVLLIIVIFLVGGILLNIFFRFGMPILFIYIVYKIIKEVMK
jgi:uncharacterized membrane protein